MIKVSAPGIPGALFCVQQMLLHLPAKSQCLAAAIVAATVIAAGITAATAATIIAATAVPARSAAAEEQDDYENDDPGITSAKTHSCFLLQIFMSRGPRTCMLVLRAADLPKSVAAAVVVTATAIITAVAVPAGSTAAEKQDDYKDDDPGVP